MDLPHRRTYCLGSVMGPHPFPTIVRDFPAVISREIRAQLLKKEGGCPTRCSPVWEAVPMPSAASITLSVIPKYG